MSGYGVEMALKKTDYLVVDDRATGSSRTSGAKTVVKATGAQSGPLNDVLGEDPWSELAIPLTASEVNGQFSCK